MKSMIAAIVSSLAVPALAEAPRVVADIAPVHSLVARVMQGVGEPDLILPHGFSPHTYSMRPSEAAALEKADLVFWIGHDLTPWLERPVETLAADAHVLSLLEVEGTVLHAYRDADEDHKGHDDHESHDDHNEDHEEHGEDDHEGHEDHHNHGDGDDPHAWLDPENAAVWVLAIAEELSEFDPDNAASYRANALSAKQEFADLKADIAKRLSEPVKYAVYHDAYQYFEKRFAQTPAFSIATTHAVAPGPKRIAELRHQAREAGLTCVFAEPLEDSKLLSTVVEGTDIGMLMIDALGTSFTPSGQLYMDMMDGLATMFETCAAQ